MEQWLSHGLTALVTAIVVYGGQFVLKLRQQSVNTLLQIIADLRGRIVSLESSLERQDKEHMECVKIQSELRGKVAFMESVAGQYLRPILAKANGGEHAEVAENIPSS